MLKLHIEQTLKKSILFFCFVLIPLIAFLSSTYPIYSGEIQPGNLVFSNAGLNAVQEFDPVSRTVVQTFPLPSPYAFTAPDLELTALVRASDHRILLNARDGSGNPVALALSSDGHFVAAKNSGGGWLQQIVFDPLDPTESTVLGGVPFLPEVRAINPFAGTASPRITRSGANFIGIATDGLGQIYAGDINAGRIFLHDQNGTFLRVFAEVGVATGSNEINGMTRDAQGNVYVAQNSSSRIAKFDSAGSFVAFLTHLAFNRPVSVFFNPNDNLLYIGNFNDGGLILLTTSGSQVAVLSLGGRFLGIPGLVPPPPNRAPVANAGPDQTVNEADTVILDGSGSNDPDGDILSFSWEQIAGTLVSLNLVDPVHPTFIAPPVPLGGETFTFRLIVSDGNLDSDPDVVNIIIKNVNKKPVADAGPDQTVMENSLVRLDGSASFDPDAEELSFSWRQVAGTAVALVNPTTVNPSFLAPPVGISGETLTFELTVDDGIDSNSDLVTVLVENVNHPPVANAGDEQTVVEGSLVTLDGTMSSDPDGDSLIFIWSQVSGLPVSLSDPNSPKPDFVAPTVPAGGDSLIFQLVVTDGLLDSDPDIVTITVIKLNDPPDCSLAQASQKVLWPPNHKLVPVEVLGLTDPNHDVVDVMVTGVTQDEPVNGLGDGDTSPDAIIDGTKVLLRAERSGTGNGRVYTVSFIASDEHGASCAGTMKVIVPANRKNGDNAVDDGQNFDSTGP